LRAIGAQASLRGAQVSFGIDWPGPPAIGAQADRTVRPPAGFAQTTLGCEHDVGRPSNSVEPALNRATILGRRAKYEAKSRKLVTDGGTKLGIVEKFRLDGRVTMVTGASSGPCLVGNPDVI